MILACENQDKIHYAMPVRTMIYDGLSYVQQMKLMWDLRDESEEILRTNENLIKYIPNYTINLIDAERIDNLDVFQKDLQAIFGLLKCRKDKQKLKLKQYVEDNKEFFSSVDMDTGMAIGAFMNSDSIIKEVKNQNEGGRVDMCKAMEDWAAEERLEGEENKLVDQIRKKLAKGKDIATIADEVEETEEVVRKLIEKHNLQN